MMKKIIYLLFICVLISCNPAANNDAQLIKQMDTAFEVIKQQYKQLAINTPDSVFPRNAENGTTHNVDIYDWTSGFFPASLWYIFHYSNDTLYLNQAIKYTQILDPLKDFIHTHDLGFMVYCPYGNGYKITADTQYRKVIIQASNSLISRFKPTVGLIKSWDSDRWQYPVIIDNMMNLEMLCAATKLSGDSIYLHIAKTHANTTLQNHFRADNSSFHLVNYDTITGNVINKQTVQGFADSSAWARGQSWGFYGYTTMFRETADSMYLKKAIMIANLLINHPNMPEDCIPYWDYNASNIPNAPRDASAAAIFASGLIELDGFVNDPQYLAFAKKIILSLSSELYLAKVGENNNFILMHSTGHLPANSEIDVPINYADYYFIEALVRLKEKMQPLNE